MEKVEEHTTANSDTVGNDDVSKQHKLHSFVAGDMVEAVYCDGCWVPGKILETGPRRVLVQYEKEDADAVEVLVGPRHLCAENETPKDVARKHDVPLNVLLSLNTTRYPELMSTSRLRARTALALPEIHVTGANETPRAVAKRFGRDLEALMQLNEGIHGIKQGARLRPDTSLVLPPPDSSSERAAPTGEAWLPPQLGESIELLATPTAAAAGASGGTAARKVADQPSWQLAVVTRLVAGGRFIASCCAEDGMVLPAGVDEGTPKPMGAAEEGVVWRRAETSYGGAPGRLGGDPSAGGTLEVGSAVEVEVSEEDTNQVGLQHVRWRPAEVRAVLEGGRFVVCVDGDEDFLEEYAPEEEGREWRLRPRMIEPERRAQEWIKHSLVRHRVPSSPADFPHGLIPHRSSIQVNQDGGWWRALFMGRVREESLNPGGAVPSPLPEFALAAAASAPAETWLVEFFERLQPSPVLRVGAAMLRPDWQWAKSGWSVSPSYADAGAGETEAPLRGGGECCRAGRAETARGMAPRYGRPGRAAVGATEGRPPGASAWRLRRR